MEHVGQELSRIIKLAKREFPSIDWSRERQETSENTASQKNEIDNIQSYYFIDRLGLNDYGDTSLHRILAMHAPSSAVQVFLRQMNTHQDILNHRDQISQEQSNFYRDLPLPPSLDQRNHKGVTPLHVAIYRNSWHVKDIVRLLLESQADYVANGRHLASIPMKCGSYPLHVMCGHNLTIKIDVLSSLLRAAPHVAIEEDINGDNPLSLLWKNVLRFRWAVSLEQGRNDISYIDGGLSWMAVITPGRFIGPSKDLFCSELLILNLVF